jgi:hypothetical protein
VSLEEVIGTRLSWSLARRIQLGVSVLGRELLSNWNWENESATARRPEMAYDTRTGENLSDEARAVAVCYRHASMSLRKSSYTIPILRTGDVNHHAWKVQQMSVDIRRMSKDELERKAMARPQ